MNAHSDDVVVVGAGIFGTATALELRRRARGVTLVDPGPVPHRAASSTDVSKMVRMDYGADVFYHELADAALDGWHRWNRVWPRPLYHETGFLVLARGPMAPGGFEHESWRVLRERGYAPQRTGGEDLSRRWPAWSGAHYADGYLSTRGGWAESGAVVAHLARLCEEEGVRMVAGSVAGLRERGSAVRGVKLGTGETIGAARVVVCAGAWTPSLLPWLGEALWATAQPVLHFAPANPTPYRGPGFLPFAADIAGSGWYGFPALPDGRVKVAHHGAGRRVAPSDPGEVGDDHVARTREFLAGAIPGLSSAPVVGRRVCLYCDTFDGDLWIDQDPEREGLVVAAGGCGHAFKFAPLLGSLVADVVEGTPNRWAARFRWRARATPRTEAARFEGT